MYTNCVTMATKHSTILDQTCISHKNSIRLISLPSFFKAVYNTVNTHTRPATLNSESRSMAFCQLPH